MDDQPQAPQENRSHLRKWLKRIGIAGFLFFLLKGIAWLVVLYGGLQIAGC